MSDEFQTHLHAARSAFAAGDMPTARTSLEACLRMAPNSPALWVGLTECRLAMGDVTGAGETVDRAIAADPNHADAFRLLAVILLRVGNPLAAEQSARRALALGSDGPAIWFQLARALESQGKLEEAVEVYRRILAAAPAETAIAINLGNLLITLGRVSEAVDCYRGVLHLDPGNAVARLNLGNALLDGCQVEAAEAEYRRAIAAAPDLGDAHWGLATCLLLQGKFREGWREYGWRWKKVDAPGAARWAVLPRWTGQHLQGGTLLVHTEQGLGDAINFARLIPAAARLAGRVVVECEPALASLLSRVDGIAEVVVRGEEIPPVAAACPLVDLALIMEIDERSIPREVPYLSAPPDLIVPWRQRLAGYGGLKVGVVWAGDPSFVADRQRSPRLAPFQPLFDLPGVTYFALQKGDGRRDLEGWVAPSNFVDLSADIATLDDTAAIMESLDLVVSSCTSPLHLAGALGRPTFGILPFVPDWRWMLERKDSPWYPTMTLFRQTAPDDWGPVMAEVRAAVAALQSDP